MGVATYRGFHLTSKGKDAVGDIWQVTIRNRVFTGHLAAVKKSIDWWCDTASLIDPEEFASLDAGNAKKDANSAQAQEIYAGYTLKNDTGEANAWYCFFNGRLIKGAKQAIKKHIRQTLTEHNRVKQTLVNNKK